MNCTSNDLRAGLRRDELTPYFQPIVSLQTGEVAGFEVLARWQRPAQSLVLPDDFIPLAERSGLIHEVMRQVVRKALRAAALLPDPLSLAVNVSPQQLRDPRFADQIRELLDAGRFPARRLHIEITETALVENLERARGIVAELKGMGCSLAIDDFGTGYSSLRHLQGLPFDKIKIDRSFVASMTTERDSRKIVAAIIGLGHSLDLVSIAEGVETEEQADMLRLLGCKMGQGWLYGKAQPAESIPRIIAAARAQARSPQSAEPLAFLEALPMERLAQLKAIYDGAPIGLCYLDRELRYVSLNRLLADMNAASVESHIGKSVMEMAPELYPRVKPYLDRALHGEAISRVEICDTTKTPKRPDCTILISYQPALDEAGEVVGISVTALDVSEWKRMEFRADPASGSCYCLAALGFNASQRQMSSVLASVVGTKPPRACSGCPGHE